MGQAIPLQGNRLSRIEEEEIIEPALDLIIQGIPDGISHTDLSKSLECVELAPSRTFVSQFLQKFEGERTSCPLVAVDGTGKEEVVTPKEGFDIGEWNGCGLVDDH